MTEQAYYRLDELPAMGITEGKLRYLLEQQQVTPAFFMHNERFIIGGYLSNKFVGFAVADYSGLVTIHKQLIPELLTKGKVSVKQVLLMQKERIRVIATTYPFQVKMPNRYIESWQPTDLTKLDWQAYPALFMPIETPCLSHKITEIFYKFSELKSSTHYDLNEVVPHTQEHELVLLNQVLKFTEVCITHTNAQNILEPRVSSNQASEIKIEQHSRELDKLVSVIMKELPEYRPTQVWSVLRAECSRQEKVYDKNEILALVSNSELVWIDANGRNRVLKQKSFFSLYKKIKDSNY